MKTHSQNHVHNKLKKAPIYYINKQTRKQQRVHDDLHRDLSYITRSNDPSKYISLKAEKVLANLVKMISKNRYKEEFVDHGFLSDLTRVRSSAQNINILTQLADIIDYEYHNCINFQGKRKVYGYVVKFTEDGEKRVTNPELFYSFNSPCKLEINNVPSQNKLSTDAKKISTSTYTKNNTEKVIEESLKALSSITVLNIDTIEKTLLSEFVSLTKETSTPVIDQAGLLCYPERAASQLCSIEQKKSATVTRLTSDQEHEHCRTHRNRDLQSKEGFIPTVDILTFANLLPPTTSAELVHIDEPNSNESQAEYTMKTYDQDNHANKLDLAISQNFDTDTSQDLTACIEYRYLEQEHKMQLIFKQKLAISEHNKNLLKKLIKRIYGNDTKIVTPRPKDQKPDVVKTSQVKKKFEAANDKTDQNPVIEEVFERFIPADEDELLKLADEIREKNKETHRSHQSDTFDFDALVAQLAATQPEIFRETR
jgi:hypothetical protein